MKKGLKIGLIVASSLMATGLALGGLALTMFGFRSVPVSGDVTERSFPVDGDFQNIRVEGLVSNIQFLPSGDDSCSVIYIGDDRLEHTVEIADDTLIIREADPVKGINLTLSENKLQVLLTRQQYQDLYIRGTSGDIDVIRDFIFRDVDIATSTGEIGYRASAIGSVTADTDTGRIILGQSQPTSVDLSSDSGSMAIVGVVTEGTFRATSNTGEIFMNFSQLGELQLEADSGDLRMDNVLANAFRFNTNTGDVSLIRCDADQMDITTDTGDITGTVLTGKSFIPTTDTGSVSVPEGTSGGECRLTTDTGDIDIQLAPEE